MLPCRASSVAAFLAFPFRLPYVFFCSPFKAGGKHFRMVFSSVSPLPFIARSDNAIFPFSETGGKRLKNVFLKLPFLRCMFPLSYFPLLSPVVERLKHTTQTRNIGTVFTSILNTNGPYISEQREYFLTRSEPHSPVLEQIYSNSEPFVPKTGFRF